MPDEERAELYRLLSVHLERQSAAAESTSGKLESLGDRFERALGSQTRWMMLLIVVVLVGLFGLAGVQMSAKVLGTEVDARPADAGLIGEAHAEEPP